MQKNFWGWIVLQPNWVGTNDAAIAFVLHAFIREVWVHIYSRRHVETVGSCWHTTQWIQVRKSLIRYWSESKNLQHRAKTGEDLLEDGRTDLFGSFCSCRSIVINLEEVRSITGTGRARQGKRHGLGQVVGRCGSYCDGQWGRLRRLLSPCFLWPNFFLFS